MRAALVVMLALAGCAGQTNYDPPADPARAETTRLVDRPVDVVWKEIVRGIGKHFFVINNLDRDSGLINVSYRGDPALFVDCGRVVSKVENLRGKRSYEFPAASAQQTYEIMNGNGLFFVDRKMDLRGRANVIVQEETGKTRVTVNVRYIVSRVTQVRKVGQQFPRNFSHTGQFNSGSSAVVGTAPTQIVCVPNGKFEKAILDLAASKSGA